MPDVLLPGIAATTVATSRLTQSVLHPEGMRPGRAGEAVLFVHGNVSSSLFWQQTLLAIAATGRHRPLAVDLPRVRRHRAAARSTRPAACATGPTTSPPWSRRSG